MIEDNPQNLYLAKFLLEKAGYEVGEARDGFEGIETARRERPDLILVDIQLPGIDGYEVMRRIKSTPGLDAIPIVAVTSYAMAGDRDKAFAAGCAGYIEKPIAPETFVAQIRRFVRLTGPRGMGDDDEDFDCGRQQGELLPP